MLQNGVLQTCITTQGSKVNQGNHMLFSHMTPWVFSFFCEVVHLKCAEVINSVSKMIFFLLELTQFYSLTS